MITYEKNGFLLTVDLDYVKEGQFDFHLQRTTFDDIRYWLVAPGKINTNFKIFIYPIRCETEKEIEFTIEDATPLDFPVLIYPGCKYTLLPQSLLERYNKVVRYSIRNEIRAGEICHEYEPCKFIFPIGIRISDVIEGDFEITTSSLAYFLNMHDNEFVILGSDFLRRFNFQIVNHPSNSTHMLLKYFDSTTFPFPPSKKTWKRDKQLLIAEIRDLMDRIGHPLCP